MGSLQEKVENAFLEAFYGNTSELKNLVDSEGFQQRLDIYTASIQNTHQQALYKIFKPAQALLGVEAFQELCYRYVAEHLSVNYNLNKYAEDFHEFVVKAPYAHHFPYISDFIEFCYLWQQVYLDPEIGVTEIHSDYPIYEIWERCQPEFGGNKEIENWNGPFIYRIFRENNKVRVLTIK